MAKDIYTFLKPMTRIKHIKTYIVARKQINWS